MRSASTPNIVSAYLDGLRQIAGITFAELAANIARLGDPRLVVSAATLKRAASGLNVPKETTVIAFVRGILGEEDEYAEHLALRRWRLARAKERGMLTRLKAPSVGNIRTRADLAAALAAAFEEAGAPPLRTLRQRAATDTINGEHLLPLSTAWRIIRREAHPADWRQCEAFLRGCGIHQRRMDQWRQAWNRTVATEHRAPVRRRPPRRREQSRRNSITSCVENSPLNPTAGARIAGSGGAAPAGTDVKAWGPVSVRRVADSSSEVTTRVSQDLARLLNQLPQHDRDTAFVLALSHLGKYPPAHHSNDIVRVGRRTDDHVGSPRLSPRETQILELVVRGFPHKNIARQLGCSVSTVATHLARVRERYRSTGRHFQRPSDYVDWARNLNADPPVVVPTTAP
ncbi:response regulator transcription factor [Streptomyces scabiei]|uniref:response regulator transcription factor n=1 Tax=Streptomyces scabiei TaxID=1930 RepID=UPI000765B1C5|nr:sigma factor-like helix-turn-helix DNA-binding protein [Streptomyces scabiei]